MNFVYYSGKDLTRKLFDLRLPLMESDDLLITRELSSEKFDLQGNRMGIFLNQYKEWNCLNQKWTVPAYINRNSEFRINSKDHGSRRGENDL